jgi:beta-galactosidase
VQKVYQPVGFDGSQITNGKLSLTNRFHMLDLSHCGLHYEIRRDGQLAEQGQLPGIVVAPGETQEIDVSSMAPKAQSFADRKYEVMVTFKLRLASDQPWAKAGHVVAWEQFAWPYQAPAEPEWPLGAVDAAESDEGIVVRGDDFSVVVSSRNGLPSSIISEGNELLVQPMRWNFWRALTDNDKGWKVDQKMGAWREAGQQAKVESMQLTRDDENRLMIAAVVAIAKPKARINVRHTVSAGGIVKTEVRFEVLPQRWKPDLPRLGIQLAMPRSYGNVSWYGRGPHENYWDRKTSAPIGRYESTVDQWVTPYVRPQENGNRCDVRSIRFTNKEGHGLQVNASGSSPLSVSAWPYSMDDLSTHRHNFELPKRDFITVNLDHLQMGVGGDNSWGLPVNAPYRIKSDRAYIWSFLLFPLR